MKNKHVGILILGMALLMFFIVMSFNMALEEIVNVSCTHGIACPMHSTLETQKAISYGLMSLLFLVGAFIFFFMKEETITKEIHTIHKEKSTEITSDKKKEIIENADEEEKMILNLLLNNQGSVYQSDVIKETKLTKVKVTRILDKLEGKGIIERKRRGMTNVIILK
ncbi:hypothetical protein COY27_06305 [Candidatus Woesearchaeota archaeon CG_4_10_14_0_2_um_filter_33_13]|nr:MAG: hypothetical protein COY27_06305 [Candidatus Woesearchaeota archaeon CG_4_10_14_0_2_um_filter_33_13]